MLQSNTGIALDSNKPLVSIGMPVFNGEEYIRGALDSLLAQSFGNFELIISDNASTDKTGKICQEYAALDKRIRYIRQRENVGAIQNFRIVLEQAQGEFFMWAAHDDRWDKHFIEKLIGVHRYDPYCGLVFCDYEVVNYITGKKYKYSTIPSTARSSYMNFMIRTLWMTPNVVYGLFKRDALFGLQFDVFDLWDVYVSIMVAAKYKIRITNSTLFYSGQKAVRREDYSLTGSKISHRDFLIHQFKVGVDNFGVVRAIFGLFFAGCNIIRMRFLAKKYDV